MKNTNKNRTIPLKIQVFEIKANETLIWYNTRTENRLRHITTHHSNGRKSKIELNGKFNSTKLIEM